MEGHKMKIKRIILTMLIIAGVLLTGCGSKKPQTARLELPANPTTGYEWQVVQDKELFDLDSEYMEDKKDEEMVGAGGTQIFTLKPKEAGETNITFSYVRPWEEGVEPDSEVSYQVEVSKDMQIKVLSSNGSLPGDIDNLPELPDMEIE